MRESIPEACSKVDAVYKYDVSAPLPLLYQLVEYIRTWLHNVGLMCFPNAPAKGVMGYGHVGDGNLHLNIMAKAYTDEVTRAIEPYVYEWIGRHEGLISAEYELGQMKQDYLGYSKSSEMVAWMRRIKTLFDPRGIMNLYKCLPET